MSGAAAERTAARLVRGVTLFERRVGEGPPVIVLHGGPGADHGYLLPGFDTLALGRELVYYDQRGGGRSPVARDVPVGWREHVADLEALRQLWALDRLIILGYSWGGLLAQLYATEHPDRVERLALVCPAPSWRAARDEFERRFAERSLAPELVAQRLALRESGLRERDPRAYERRLFELAVVPYFYDPARASDLTPFRVVGRTQQEVWRSLNDYDLRPALRRLRLPALVLHGEDDPIPIEASRETAALLGAEFHALDRCGHCPHVERLEDFRRLLDAFL
ncbi:MAG: alpha/beta fold hydrolase [Gemmatimonadota bacterium]